MSCKQKGHTKDDADQGGEEKRHERSLRSRSKQAALGQEQTLQHESNNQGRSKCKREEACHLTRIDVVVMLGNGGLR